MGEGRGRRRVGKLRARLMNPNRKLVTRVALSFQNLFQKLFPCDGDERSPLLACPKITYECQFSYLSALGFFFFFIYFLLAVSVVDVFCLLSQ